MVQTVMAFNKPSAVKGLLLQSDNVKCSLLVYGPVPDTSENRGLHFHNKLGGWTVEQRCVFEQHQYLKSASNCLCHGIEPVSCLNTVPEIVKYLVYIYNENITRFSIYSQGFVKSLFRA